MTAPAPGGRDAGPGAPEAADLSPRVADLAAHLDRHEPIDDVEAVHLQRTRAALWADHDPLSREDDRVHVTGSAIVLPTDGSDRTVLHLHKRLRRWLQPGGHVDPGERAQDAALREAGEETGLVVDHPPGGPVLVHVHVHDGGRGHVHLDTRWLLLADPDQAFAPEEGESDSVHWVAFDDLADVADDSVTVAVTAAMRHRRSPA